MQIKTNKQKGKAKRKNNEMKIQQIDEQTNKKVEID